MDMSTPSAIVLGPQTSLEVRPVLVSQIPHMMKAVQVSPPLIVNEFVVPRENGLSKLSSPVFDDLTNSPPVILYPVPVLIKVDSSKGRTQNPYGFSLLSGSNLVEVYGSSQLDAPTSLTNLTYSLYVLALSLVPNSKQTLK